MNRQGLDLRYPEAYLRDIAIDCSADQMNKATSFGKDYRQLRIDLKKYIELKKGLSKEFVEISGNPVVKKAHIESVRRVNDKIKATKLKLKLLEQNIRELVNPDENEERILPPQFSKKKKLKVAENFVIEFSELDSSREKQWCEYVNSHPNASIYHSSEIKNVIKKTFHHNTLYLIATNGNGSICGVLPLVHLKSRLFGDYWCSVPFFNYGGVLADNDLIEKKMIDFAWNKIASSHSRYIEYRHSHEVPGMPVRKNKVGMVLELPDQKEILWKNLGTKLRAQINKASSHNHYFKIGEEELVNDFYKVFALNMRDLGTPVYSKNLFINMLLEVPRSNIIVLYVENKAVSAGFLVGWKNTLEIPWASTIRKANKYNSNMLLYWYILQFAIKEGYGFFDFGRSSKEGSTYKFKKQWGALEHQLYWHYSKSDDTELPDITTNNPKYKLAIKVWQHLPVWFANIIGPYLVRYIS